ncbi:MAG: ThiF family adenylyltransferase [Chloroflexi bacterium]|nr:ThiF family adenylyltransferase [Chloroflexota bacterium]
MAYYLDNTHLVDNPWITVVGCGGTGGFVAEGLCRLFQGREATIVLVDHDRVEPHNLLRQNFLPEDVGRFKSQALADRLARAYRRPVGYSVYPFREDAETYGMRRYPGLAPDGAGLILGCVDNAAGRRAMADCLPGNPGVWLVDAGNDTNWGQVLIGNVADEMTWDEGAFTGETCHLLPAPTVQRPDLLTAVPTAPPDVDCAAALDLTDQDPVINQVMAALALQAVRRLVAGTCPFMALYLDMEQGSVTPTYATPEAVARTLGGEHGPA